MDFQFNDPIKNSSESIIMSIGKQDTGLMLVKNKERKMKRKNIRN